MRWVTVGCGGDGGPGARMELERGLLFESASSRRRTTLQTYHRLQIPISPGTTASKKGPVVSEEISICF
jgi:hypothetical protein